MILHLLYIVVKCLKMLIVVNNYELFEILKAVL